MQDADGSHRLTQHHLMDSWPADPGQLTPVPFPRDRRCYPESLSPPLPRPAVIGLRQECGEGQRGNVDPARFRPLIPTEAALRLLFCLSRRRAKA